MRGRVCVRRAIDYRIQQNEIIVDPEGSVTTQQQTENFNGTTLLITRGTGTFGDAIVEMRAKRDSARSASSAGGGKAGHYRQVQPTEGCANSGHSSHSLRFRVSIVMGRVYEQSL